MLILSTNSPSPVLSPPASSVGTGEMVDGNSLENADTVSDDTGDEIPFPPDRKHHAKLDEASVEIPRVAEAIAETVDEHWGIPTPARSGKKLKKRRG